MIKNMNSFFGNFFQNLQFSWEWHHTVKTANVFVVSNYRFLASSLTKHQYSRSNMKWLQKNNAEAERISYDP